MSLGYLTRHILLNVWRGECILDGQPNVTLALYTYLPLSPFVSSVIPFAESLTTDALPHQGHARAPSGSAFTVCYLQETQVVVGDAVAAADREEDAGALL